jgi:hypothetical protein
MIAAIADRLRSQFDLKGGPSARMISRLFI